MGKVSGYTLSVIFGTDKKLAKEESEELCDKIMDIFASWDSVSFVFSPIIEEEEAEQ